MLPYHTTPTEGNELGDLSNFKISSEERIIMADWLRARREGSQAQRTQLAPTPTIISPATTPSNTSGRNVTSEDIEAALKGLPFIDEILSPLNTASGNQFIKEARPSTTNARIVELPDTSTTPGSTPDKGESNRNASADMKNSSDNLPPLNGLWAQGTLQSAEESDISGTDMSGLAKRVFVKTSTNEQVEKISNQAETDDINVAVTAAERLRMNLVAGGSEFAIRARLVLGDKLTESECLELSSVLIAMVISLCKGDKVAIARLKSLKDVWGAPPHATRVFEEILQVTQITFLNALEELCTKMNYHALKQDITRLVTNLETNRVHLGDIRNGESSVIFKKFTDLLWQRKDISSLQFEALVEAFNAKLSRMMKLSTVLLQNVSKMQVEHSNLARIAEHFEYPCDRLLKPKVTGRELLKEIPTNVEGVLIKEILMRTNVSDFLQNDEYLDHTAMTKADNDIKDARAKNKDVSQPKTLLMGTHDQQDDDGSAADDAQGNAANVNSNIKTRVDRGCTDIPRDKRSALENYIVENASTKASDGKLFCISYNIARLSLKKNDKQAEQACRKFNYKLKCKRGQCCPKNHSHTLMDISGFLSANAQSDGDAKPNDP